MSIHEWQTTIVGADLRVKCLNCGTITRLTSVDLTLKAVMDMEEFVFLYYRVALSKQLICDHALANNRFQIRGETAGSVFALPCIIWQPLGWKSLPDSNRDHFAIKAKA